MKLGVPTYKILYVFLLLQGSGERKRERKKGNENKSQVGFGGSGLIKNVLLIPLPMRDLSPTHSLFPSVYIDTNTHTSSTLLLGNVLFVSVIVVSD